MDDIENFRWNHKDRLEQVAATPRKRSRSKPFLKGPIPWHWIEQAATSRHRSTILVGLVIWYQAGRQQTHTEIVVCAKQTEKLFLGRKGFNAGLNELVRLGLIKKEDHPGRCVRVELLVVNDEIQS